MRNLVCGTLFFVLLSALPAAADQISDLTKQIGLLEKQIELATKQRDLAALRKTSAEAQRDAAAALLKAEQDKLAAAQEALKKPSQPVPAIKMVEGTLSVVGGGGPHPTCDALPYLRWQCNGTQNCPAFTVDEKICGIPGTSSDPMLLSVKYLCGDDVRVDDFPFSKPAHLSCN